MRIAFLADIHGNPIALDAVLADLHAQAPFDEIWVLGDLVALGHDPAGVLQRLDMLSNARTIRGNTDRYVAGEHPGPTLEEMRADPDKIRSFVTIWNSFAWTRGAVVALDKMAWLAALPLERRLTLPDGTRLLAVHASPGTDDGAGLHPGQTEEEQRALLAGCNADLVLVAHNHWVMDVQVDGVRVVNPGSVSNPPAPDLRAKWATLEADDEDYRIEQRYVDYDHAAVIEAVRRARQPSAEYIVRFMLGQNQPEWRKGK
jgi:predicted phosphodiesterase